MDETIRAIIQSNYGVLTLISYLDYIDTWCQVGTQLGFRSLLAIYTEPFSIGNTVHTGPLAIGKCPDIKVLLFL